MLTLKNYTGGASTINVEGAYGSVAVYNASSVDVTDDLINAEVLRFSESNDVFAELFGNDWAQVAKYNLDLGGLTDGDLTVFK